MNTLKITVKRESYAACVYVNDDTSILDYKASNIRWLVHNELEMFWKEAVVAKLKLLGQNLIKESEESLGFVGLLAEI